MNNHIDPYVMRTIRNEIKKQMYVLLQGISGNADPTKWTEDIEQIYPGSDTITERPVAHPFGFVSRAPRGTMQIVARMGDHPNNRMVLSHRDGERPTDLDDGTSKIYSIAGFQVYAGEDGVYVGKGSATEPLILGTVANEFFGALLDLIVAHVHPGPGSPPNNAADFTQLKTQTIETDSLLSIDGGGL